MLNEKGVGTSPFQHHYRTTLRYEALFVALNISNNIGTMFVNLFLSLL